MNIKDLERVNEINKVICGCKKQIDAVELWEPDWWLQVSKHSDGSGHKLDFNGLGCTEKVLESLKSILQARIQECNNELQSLGVQINDKSNTETN